jgi:hypothetical protein
LKSKTREPGEPGSENFLLRPDLPTNTDGPSVNTIKKLTLTKSCIIFLPTFFCNTVEIVPMNSERVETLVAVIEAGAGFALVPGADDGIHTTPIALYASMPVANNLQLV